MSRSRDGQVCVHASWVCVSESALSDVISTRRDGEDVGDDAQLSSATSKVVCLKRAEEDSPCIITLLCSPNSGSVICGVEVLSEARTIEVYSLCGEYCGTSRGELHHTDDGAEEKRTFYQTLLVLESPVPSCEVKLMSLGGRTAVCVAHMLVRLSSQHALPHCPESSNPTGIDLQRVKSMMEEMGTSLSPGAHNLMEMLQHQQQQQQNRADVLGGLLPLLLGGGLMSTPSGEVSSAAPAPSSSDPSCPAPMLLPMLQSVCGQVTQLRLDANKSPEKKNGEREGEVCCGGLEKVLESVVERRMEVLEKRLMEHVDQRLDALQRKLELTIQQAFTHSTHTQ